MRQFPALSRAPAGAQSPSRRDENAKHHTYGFLNGLTFRTDTSLSVDPKVGSMIPEDLSTKCSIGSMIQSDHMVKFDSRCWIPFDPSVIMDVGLNFNEKCC